MMELFPPISVVIPARNEAVTLSPLIRALRRQSLAPAEILVVDAGSTDDTGLVVHALADGTIRLLESGPLFPGAARNRGIQAARYEWIALIDAGCEPADAWLESLVSAARQLGTQGGVVWGTFAPVVETAWDAAQALVVGPYCPADARHHQRSVASALIRRDTWAATGGFRDDLRAAEDLLFFERLQQAGVAQVYAPAADVRWHLSPSVGTYVRRLVQYSAHHARAGLWTTWHLRVGLMDLGGIILAGLGLFWWPALAVVGLSAAARLVRTVHQRRGNVPGGPWRAPILLRAAWLLLLADAAMWAGLWDLAWDRKSSA